MRPTQRVAANLQALEQLRVAQMTGGVTPEAQEAIAGWSGWGALPQMFDPRNDEFAPQRELLQETLDDDLYRAAARTTLNAHYTDAAVVTAMWDTLRRLGVDGGEVLEPGSGSGNFIGLMPEALRDAGTHVTGVEVDPVSANVARALYPDATIRTESFAQTPIQSGAVDVVIGNVPFGQVRLHDRRHNPDNLPIHDHFLTKSVDLLKPGGTMAVLTSRYTLDKSDDTARRAIHAQADLLGAVRLPVGAHRRAAGTDVVTDVLVFRRRRDGEAPSGDTSWLHSHEADGVRVSDYFAEHPEHVLGETRLGHGPYGPDLQVVSGDLAQTPEQLVERLTQIADQAVEDGRAHAPVATDAPRITQEPPVAEMGDPSRFTGFIRAHDDGTFTQIVDGAPQPFEVPASRRAEMRALLGLRDTTLALLDAEAASSEDNSDTDRLRAQLNTRYDDYVSRYGPINRVTRSRTGRVDDNGDDIMRRLLPPSIKQFATDPFSAPVRALETYDEAAGTATKAQIFTVRVLERRATVTRADTPADALAMTLDREGHVDLAVVAGLLDLPDEASARDQLGDLVYLDPADERLVPAAEYLSGDVRTKLAQAEHAASTDPTYQVNVDRLAEVVPDDLGPEDIHASLGAVWIPASDVQAFLQETLDDPSVTVTHGTGAMWSVKGDRRSVAATSVWGTNRVDAIDLAERLLQQRQPIVTDEVDAPDGERKTRVTNPVETEAASEKAAQMRERFAAWTWEDPARGARLAGTYNAMFNSHVLRRYDGEHLSFPGLATWFTPHAHQRAAVHRMLSEPSVGLFHQVGAGKTAEMVMGAQELKRLGMVDKPAIVVPNHMLEQFTREYLAFYPRANVLAAGSEDLDADKRRLFVAKAATGDWDAIIMTRGAFGSIPVSEDTEAAYMDREQATLRAGLERMRTGDDTRMIKRMETRIANNEERLRKTLDQRRDSGLTFEQLGIDYLMVDELHDYKNLRIVSSIRDAAHKGSIRAADLDMKLDYLRRTHGDRVFTGATATPIANSVAEAYVMQRYTRPDLLEQVGMVDFDSWAATFGETTTDIELAPEGGGNFRTTTRFSKFRNVPELLRMWHISADVKTGDDLPYLKRPALRARPDGQRLPESVAIAPSDSLRAYVADLADRADAVRRSLVEPDKDNMLKVTGDGRAAALDLRLVTDPDAADELFPVPSKLDVAADRIHSIWQTHRDDTYPVAGTDQPHPTPGSLQIVFCDLGTPTGDARLDVYSELRSHLADRGMDPRRVRFIHEANNDAKKASLFAQARTGQIDVLIGSTSKMGVGTNIQDRVVALHHLDCPWRPADIEQREGRALRQGNLNPEVGIYRYAVEGSFDAYSWQTVERKSRFIDQIMRGTLDQREIEDIGDSTLSYTEVKALASGDPLVLERAEAQREVSTLTRLETSHQRAQAGLRSRIHVATKDIEMLTERIPTIEAAAARRTDTAGDAFRATVAGTTHTERSDAATALRHALGEHVATLDVHTRREVRVPGVLSLGGQTFDGHATIAPSGRTVWLQHTDLPQVEAAVNLSQEGIGAITRAENVVVRLPARVEDAHNALAHSHRELEHAQAEIGQPFARADDLTAAQQRLADIDAKMNAQVEGPPTTPPPDAPAPDATSPSADSKPLPPHEARQRARAVIDRLERSHDSDARRRQDVPPAHRDTPPGQAPRQ